MQYILAHIISLLLKVLERVHEAFFAAGDSGGRDTRALLQGVRQDVLAGCTLLFSALFPRSAVPQDDYYWQLAEKVGCAQLLTLTIPVCQFGSAAAWLPNAIRCNSWRPALCTICPDAASLYTASCLTDSAAGGPVPAAGSNLRHHYRAGRHACGHSATRHRQSNVGAFQRQARRLDRLAAALRRAALSAANSGVATVCDAAMPYLRECQLFAHAPAFNLEWPSASALHCADGLRTGGAAGYLWKRQPEADFPVIKPQAAPPAASAGAPAGGPVSDLDAALAAAGGGGASAGP